MGKFGGGMFGGTGAGGPGFAGPSMSGIMGMGGGAPMMGGMGVPQMGGMPFNGMAPMGMMPYQAGGVGQMPGFTPQPAARAQAMQPSLGQPPGWSTGRSLVNPPNAPQMPGGPVMGAGDPRNAPVRPAPGVGPQPAPGMVPGQRPQTHPLARGENPWSVSQKYGVPHGQLMQANNLNNASARRLPIGYQMQIPSGGGQGFAAAPPFPGQPPMPTRNPGAPMASAGTPSLPSMQGQRPQMAMASAPMGQSAPQYSPPTPAPRTMPTGVAGNYLTRQPTGVAPVAEPAVNAPTHPGNMAGLNGLAGANSGESALHKGIIGAEGTDKYAQHGFNSPYDVPLGYGQYGRPSKPLTDMTLGEVYGFGRGVRAQHGSSSAVGAFQITGRTMKDFMAKAGLSWNDKFTPANQRKLADAIHKGQGLGAWEGFKHNPALRASMTGLGY
jgi:hypothetical protein